MNLFNLHELGYYLSAETVELAQQYNDIYAYMLNARVEIVLKYKMVYASDMLAYDGKDFDTLGRLYGLAQSALVASNQVGFVRDIPEDYNLVVCDQAVEALHELSISSEFKAYFAKYGDNGEVVGLYGMYNSVPWPGAAAKDALAGHIGLFYASS